MKIQIPKGKEYELQVDSFTLKEWIEMNPDLRESILEMLTKDKIATGSVSIGYLKYPDRNEARPIPEQLIPIIECLDRTRFKQSMSLREAHGVLKSFGLDFRSQQSVTNAMDRCEQALGFLKELAPSVKAKCRNATEERKVMRQRREAAREKRLSKERKEKIKALEKEEERKKKKIVKDAKESFMTMQELTDSPKNGYDDLIAKAKSGGKEVAFEEPDIPEEHILFRPTPKQAEFLAAPEKVILYGGAAGGIVNRNNSTIAPLPRER